MVHYFAVMSVTAIINAKSYCIVSSRMTPVWE